MPYKPLGDTIPEVISSQPGMLLTKKRSRSYAERPFIAWDGEACLGQDGYHPYSLFGCGTSHYVSYFDISTRDLLSCIHEAPDGIHVSFSFNYDVNNILKDLPVKSFERMKETTWCRYGGYNIQHIPRKWFTVSNKQRTVKIFDLFGFFMSSFETAIKNYGVGTEEERERVREGKADRALFAFHEMQEKILPYWATELKLMVELAEKLRSIIYGAGFQIRSWHGPSAVAGHVMKKNKAELYRSTTKNTPAEVLEAARYAYFGGRFQPFKAGLYEGPVWTYDINTAYGFTNARIPNLANGKWSHHTESLREATSQFRTGLFHLRFNLGRSDGGYPMPLPHRDVNRRISFPVATEGWYHISEAYNVRNTDKVEFIEAWLYEDDGTYPFSWFQDMYSERLQLQDINDPAEKALKWAIASAYGLRAQRVGWNKETKEPPRFHDLIAAGMITSECRAMVHMVAVQAAKQNGLVSIDTDGIISTVAVSSLPNGVGNNLGQWKIEQYTGILYYQSGIYWLRDKSGNWLPPKSRGIPRKKLPIALAIEALDTQSNIRVPVHSFVGYGLASKRNWKNWRRWVDEEREFVFGGTGKTMHVPAGCRECHREIAWNEGLHTLFTIPPKQLLSTPHMLPWNDGYIEDSEEQAEFDLPRWMIYG